MSTTIASQPVSAGMPCPRCRVDLMMSDRQGIEIDYCPQCRGVWLDRGELDKIIERNAQFYTPSPQDTPQQASPTPFLPPNTPGAGPGQPPGYAPSPAAWGQGYGNDQHGGGHGDGHGGGNRGGYGQHNSFLGRLFG